jgi:hypothetical protein
MQFYCYLTCGLSKYGSIASFMSALLLLPAYARLKRCKYIVSPSTVFRSSHHLLMRLCQPCSPCIPPRHFEYPCSQGHRTNMAVLIVHYASLEAATFGFKAADASSTHKSDTVYPRFSNDIDQSFPIKQRQVMVVSSSGRPQLANLRGRCKRRRGIGRGGAVLSRLGVSW